MSIPADSEWKTPFHAPPRHHQPIPGGDWPDIVRKTKKGNSRYGPHPAIKSSDVNSMEMGLVKEVQEFEAMLANKGKKSRQEIDPRLNDNIRAFWKEQPAKIGASDGVETAFIYVEYGLAGNVHGYPVTKQWLQSLGVNI